uniref:Uncharacterized protein n=1 Tax=Arundo donax TaxID=35708 RepID=A0A0A9E5J7_ARUDO
MTATTATAGAARGSATPRQPPRSRGTVCYARRGPAPPSRSYPDQPSFHHRCRRR